MVNLLNQALGDRYDPYIDLPREERIRALNAELAPITENITHAFPASVLVITTKCWMRYHLRAFSAISE